MLKYIPVQYRVCRKSESDVRRGTESIETKGSHNPPMLPCEPTYLETFSSQAGLHGKLELN